MSAGLFNCAIWFTLLGVFVGRNLPAETFGAGIMIVATIGAMSWDAVSK